MKKDIIRWFNSIQHFLRFSYNDYDIEIRIDLSHYSIEDAPISYLMI
jgi:hypothetical protein